ncbi:MAG: YIP1 family protein [Deferribacteres bacterium]|nr:YIP1 family protein [candidate division KSB1 bacterium]MCB9510116.1 YIP1 family protein [Deferribacteres bacterium]
MMPIIDRIKNILMAPKSEFPTVKAEAVDIAGYYKSYLIYIAALPAIGTLLSFGAYWGFSYRLRLAIISYLVTLASFYISAFIINELAQTFQSTKSLINALKLVGYAATASMVGQLLAFLPGIGWLLSLAGSVYSIYLFYLGIPIFMDTPQEKTILYMVVAFLVSIVVYSILAAVLFPFFGVSLMWR